MNENIISGALVLGCGYTGSVLVRKLQSAGIPTWGTTRTAEKANLLKEQGVNALVWNALDPLPAVAADTAFVLYPPGDMDPAEMTRHFSSAMRIVVCSSTSVYGDMQGDWVDEDTVCDPSSLRGKRRVAMEQAFQQRQGCVVRPGGIYGPGRNIVTRHAAGRLFMAKDAALDRWVNLIHVEDLADMLWAAARFGEPAAIYNAVDGNPQPWRALVDVAERMTGKPVRPAEDGSHSMRSFTRESRRIRSDRARQDLGFEFAHPDSVAALKTMSTDC